MIAVVPDPDTKSLVTSIVSTVESSENFLIVIFPVSTSTASEKLRTISLVVAISFESSAGLELLRVGAVSSAVVKLSVVFSLIPAKEFPAASSKTSASICM